ncbi:hypothetical protein [Minwuia sp. IMCC3009]|jgi:hypothetical protein|uniref:hypothetical protein n=1 Tax=Minwuia sp. IMCC3009 TaxID=3040674 RepID=UPI002479E57B|nr:hypothetical protein [Minwuia sp. IMCC3009]
MAVSISEASVPTAEYLRPQPLQAFDSAISSPCRILEETVATVEAKADLLLVVPVLPEPRNTAVVEAAAQCTTHTGGDQDNRLSAESGQSGGPLALVATEDDEETPTAA